MFLSKEGTRKIYWFFFEENGVAEKKTLMKTGEKKCLRASFTKNPSSLLKKKQKTQQIS